ncbi:ABC transporter ATP-binding protein [Falsiroseomonas stagni]|uniref:Multiple sugar transport system ATP-binding protein n=1 Tax=Falsiroseomonas stagni DSM 19981 TaxID=1123062 RepID=A0A1I4DSH6_9PROT|nr:ABC transporter ATP-binding protein [Falsiroseomonas stagni]SFK96638.1 multiple sugar transport system ATP-binding protein [Falsiroseomonas stagni DSM 19981]
MSAAEVTFTRVRKAFGDAVAVKGLDLSIRPGEFVSLLGPSGCGKTTTLRMLAGLEFPTSGEISIGGRVVNDVAPGKRDIAMVFQSYALYPHMTVGENIAYPLKKQGMAKAERATHVARIAAMLKLEALLDRKPRQLSGGQQQRVALGRALVRSPKVFLLDEPLSNLDAKLRAHMRAELIELHRTLGRTFVYVTHDQLEAMTMSDRIAVMEGGELRQFAPPREVYDRPANLFVAGFIGTPPMNTLPGSFADGVYTHPAITVRFAVTGAGSKVVLGVRPEDVLIGQGPYRATVRVVEPTGHETIVMLDAGGSPLTARTPAESTLNPGDVVSFALRAERLHLFDATSEARLDARAMSVEESV